MPVIHLVLPATVGLYCVGADRTRSRSSDLDMVTCRACLTKRLEQLQATRR